MPAATLKPRPFQYGSPSHEGDLLNASDVCGRLGLGEPWHCSRLWSLGYLAAVLTPSGEPRYFSKSVEQYAAAGMPNSTPQYQTVEQFRDGSFEDREFCQSVEGRLSDFVAKNPMDPDQQREFAKRHGMSGFRDIVPGGDLATFLRGDVDQSRLSMFSIKPELLDSPQPSPLSGRVGERFLGCHLRRVIASDFGDRPHRYGGSLFDLFSAGPEKTNELLANCFDKLNQRKFGFRSSRYSVELQADWDANFRQFATRQVQLDVSESVRGSAILAGLDRRAVVLGSL